MSRKSFLLIKSQHLKSQVSKELTRLISSKTKCSLYEFLIHSFWSASALRQIIKLNQQKVFNVIVTLKPSVNAENVVKNVVEYVVYPLISPSLNWVLDRENDYVIKKLLTF